MAFLHKKLVKDSVPGFLQVIINQCCGLAIFLVLSVQLNKAAFGEINWALAVLLSSFAILGFGIDQLVVKKIAAGSDNSEVTSLYLLHTLLTGGVFYLLLVAGQFLFPSFFTAHYFLLWLAMGKLAVFVASVFRQLANGRERFRLLALMMVVSNVLRALALLVLWGLHQVNTASVIWVFVAGDMVELLACWWLARSRFKLQLSFAGRCWQQYRQLLKESLPQLGSTILAAATARMDWMLMGLMGMSVQLADYSFAYKIFEMAMLPLAIIGPLLIPRFTRMFNPDFAVGCKICPKGRRKPPKRALSGLTLTKMRSILRQPKANFAIAKFGFNTPGSDTGKLFTLLRLEMVLAAGTALVLYILWVPVIGWLTQGRYGAVNSSTVLLLGAAIPFLYLNNLLWTVLFTKGHLKQIFRIMLVVFIFNLAGNLLLIPRYAGEGAAIAWLAASALQSILLLVAVNIKKMIVYAGWLPVCILCAAGAGYTANYFFTGILVIFSVAILLYLLLVVVTGALHSKDIKALQ
jgi:O-antigen/teichoic acid export membrane protein